MSEVIRFLESMATTAYVSAPSDADLDEAIAPLAIEPAQKQALLARDHAGLSELLGGRTRMFFGLATPQRDAPMREEEEEPTPADAPEEPEQTS